MKFIFALISTLATPALAFQCPAGAHLCSRPSATSDVRNLCVQFNGTTIEGINDSAYHVREFNFKNERHWSGCKSVFFSECVDQWVKVSSSNVRGYKYSFSPYEPGESLYQYLDLNLKTNQATLRSISYGVEDVQDYECKKLTETYQDYFTDYIVRPLPPCSEYLVSPR